MRKLILLIVAGLALGALFGHLMMSVPGYWLIRVGETSVQTSFWFGLVVLLAAFYRSPLRATPAHRHSAPHGSLSPLERPRA